ncbi:CU044_5270 family protein [Allokutzneria albata]|uniref:CU044_5270 family protein n=1 Tax=Allokutzneria albata TaxID=211114 RepID=A0A1G9VRA2_ALLAB|nr:CU044_5270 family protein [Allokutzneria albata]SDM74501.1 hypothetical protein SAMN04489726_3179 [Allokutzneria albata]
MRDNDDRIDLAVRELAPEVPPMSEHAFDTGRERVLAGPGRRPRRSRRGLVAAAVLAVLTLGTVGVLNFSGTAPPANAEAVTLLTKAADVTADAPVGPGQYRYVKTTESRWRGVVLHGASSANCWFRTERTEETWIPADRNQDWLRRTTSTEPLETRSCTKDEAKNAPFASTEVSPWESRAKDGKFVWPASLVREGKPPAGLEPLSVRTQPAREIPPNIYHPTPEFLAGLPRDPQRLFTLLRDSTCAADVCALFGARGLLGSGQTTDELRAAVYRALTRIPGMSVADGQANLHGRIGTALRVITPEQTQDIIIDRETGDYIGDRTVRTESWGKVVESTSVASGITRELGAQPR